MQIQKYRLDASGLVYAPRWVRDHTTSPDWFTEETTTTALVGERSRKFPRLRPVARLDRVQLRYHPQELQGGTTMEQTQRQRVQRQFGRKRGCFPSLSNWQPQNTVVGASHQPKQVQILWILGRQC